MDSGLIQITYAKSAVGYSQRQKATIRALGLRRLGDVVIQADIPAIRGMVARVEHLVRVDPVGRVDVVAESDQAGTAARGRTKRATAKSGNGDES